MYHDNFFKKRSRLAKKLNELFSEKGVKAKSSTFVWETYGADLLGMGKDTFLKRCSEPADEGDEPPLYIEAALRSLARNREMAERYESGAIELWEIPHTGEYADLIETIRDRKRKAQEAQAEQEAHDAREKARSGEAAGRTEKEPVGQD